MFWQLTKWTYFQFNEKKKKIDVLLSLYFQYKIIKVESKINKFMSFWRMAVVGYHTSVNCWVQKNCFSNSILKLKKKKTAVNWSTVCCCFYKQLGKLQAIFARPNNYVSSNMIFSSCSIMYFPTCIIGKEQMYILDYFRTCILNIINWPALRKHRCTKQGSMPESGRKTRQAPSS